MASTAEILVDAWEKWDAKPGDRPACVRFHEAGEAWALEHGVKWLVARSKMSTMRRQVPQPSRAEIVRTIAGVVT